MAKQLNVNMKFNADTSEARAQIQALHQSLKDISKMPGNPSSLFDDSQLKKASQAALELQTHLQRAVNINTGKLDLSRFASSLKASNKDLSSYTNTLLSVGQQGQQAFLQLANAIAAADTPTTRINAKLAELGTTLKNTAKWQISSSVLHGFMGAVQSAYGYAQNLNRSLNDIRIVTGQNIDQMSEFAEKANRAAKALSTTTTDYTKASLIYYQQGLDDSEVKERTDITIKMANAAGQSAEIVSDQMTAVWNNFDNGSKSLEYYADVMTALGAATASSTDEIAAGLEKFAAISSTVGLSYEYATAALATVTDKTRQSADVVGTAFKTMFARIQGLELGETLEDGTDLNKYSEALATVGVDIKDANGELRNMDNILADMAGVWETLNRDQQVALAQTVAGVRQYSQLMSLMENWDAMELNLGVVETSEGELQKQADIYAESWEGAQDRVRAAAEGIYQDLIDDEFFIDLLNGFEKLLEGINGVVQGFGGMKGVITAVGGLFLSYYANKMPDTLNNFKQNMMVFTGQAKKEMDILQKQTSKKLGDITAEDSGYSKAYKIEAEGINKVIAMKQSLIAKSRQLTSEQRAHYEATIDNVEAIYKEVVALQKAEDAAKKKLDTSKKDLAKSGSQGFEKLLGDYQKAEDRTSKYEQKTLDASDQNNGVLFEQYDALFQKSKANTAELEMEVSSLLKAYGLGADEVESFMTTLRDEHKLTAEQMAQLKQIVQTVSDEYSEMVTQAAVAESVGTSTRQQAQDWKMVAASMKEGSAATDEMKSKMKLYVSELKNLSKVGGFEELNTDFDNFMKDIDEGKFTVQELADKFEALEKIVSSATSAAGKNAEDKIETLDKRMDDMKFDPEVRKGMQENAGKVAESQVRTIQGWQNGRSAAEDMAKSTFHVSTALTEFASTAMAAYSVATTLKSAFQTFGDEDASGFEKIGAAISILMSTMGAFNSLRQLSMTLAESETAIEIGLAAKKAILTKVIKQGTIAKQAENIAWLQSPITWIAAVVMGVVAAFGVLITVISGVTKALSDMYNADAIALEHATQAATNLANAYDEARQKYDDMISSMENYKTAQDSLNSLAESTEEYRKKLNEANQEALQLIKLLGLIRGEGYDVKGGEIIIKEESEDYKTKSEAVFDDTQKAYAASTMANAQQEIAEARNIQTELIQEDDSRNVKIGATVGATTGAGAGATIGANTLGGVGATLLGAIGSIAGPVGTAIGAAVGDFLGKGIGAALGGIGGFVVGGAAGFAGGAITNSIENKNDEEKINNLVEEYKKLGDVVFEKQKLTELGFEDVTEDYIASLQEIVQAHITGADTLKTASDVASAAILDLNPDAQKSGSKENIQEAGSNIYSDKYTDLYDTYLEKLENKDGISSKENRDTWDEYQKSALKNLDGVRVENYRKDGFIDYSYIQKNEDGTSKRVNTSVSAEEIATKLASDKASEHLNTVSDSLVKVFESLDNIGNKYADAVSSLLSSGDLAGATMSELTAFSDAEGNVNEDVLTKFIEKNISSEDLQAMGYANATEYVEAFKQQYEKAMAEWEGLDAYKDYSLEEAQQLSKISSTTGIKDQELINYYEGLNEEERAVLLELDIDEDASLENFDEAISNVLAQTSNTEEDIKALGLDPKEFEDLTDYIQDTAEASDDLADSLETDKKTAKEVAKEMLRFDKAVKSVTDNYKDWKKALDDKDLVKMPKLIKEIEKAYTDMLDLDVDTLSEDFLTNANNLELMKKAANGSKDAYNQLQIAAAKDIFKSSGLETLPEKVSSLITELANIEGIDIGEKIVVGENAVADKLRQMYINAGDAIIQGGGSAAEAMAIANDMINSVGFDVPEIEMEARTVTVTGDLPDGWNPLPDGTMEGPDGQILQGVKWTQKEGGTYTYTQTYMVPKNNATFTKTAENYGGSTSNNNNGGGGGGGGGGGAPKPAKKVKKTKKTDVVDRYKEVTDSLDKNTKALEKASKKADYLYGPGRIKWLKKSNELIKQQNNLLKQQVDEAKTNLDIDQKALDLAAQDLEIEFSYDKDGYIKNYTAEMEKVFAELSKAEDTINGFKTQDEQDKYREETLQPLQDKIEALKEAQTQYEETMQLIDQLNQQQEDNLRQLENNKAAMITHVIELKVVVNDEDLKHLDFLISRLEAREFRTASLLSQMQNYLGIYQNQANTAQNGMDRYLTQWLTEDEKEKFYNGQAGQINWTNKENLPDDFWQSIQGWMDEVRDATQSAFELRSEVYDQLNSAFSDLTSEIDRAIDKFDHLTSVIDSYNNIIDLSGQKNQFTKNELKEINQTRVKVANRKLESAEDRKTSYETYAADRKSEYDADLATRDQIRAELKTATGDRKKQLQGELEAIEQQIKLSKQAWQDAEDAAMNANEAFLTAWEEALQASRDAFLANVELELDLMEEKMAGAYGSFESMQEAFDRNSEINDRYLEDYERVYELSKLSRDLEKKMDETSNIKAKKELAKLQEEILFYQEEGRKMSDYDLEYLQKKYDLRVAEIAMEEAQNAKSQVRLTRDSEGNYSYTYTADEDAMAESQQSYEDKLYAITELSNEYIKEQTGNLIQAQIDLNEALRKINEDYANGIIETEEEYYRAIDECTAYYTGQMNYYGGEIDKASIRNMQIYRGDYANYERYVGDKIDQTQKMSNEMDAEILASQEKTMILTTEKQAAVDAVHYAFAQGLIKDQTALNAELAKIDEKYDGQIKASTNKTTSLLAERNKQYAAHTGEYKGYITEKEKAESGLVTGIEKLLPKFEKTQTTASDYVKNCTEKIAGKDGNGGYVGHIKKEFQKLQTNIASNMTAAGTSTKDFAADVKKALTDKSNPKSVVNSAKGVTDEVNSLIKKLTGKNGLTNTAKGMHTWAISINSDIGTMITKYKDLEKAVQNANKALSKQAEKQLDGEKPNNPTPTPPTDENKDEGDGVAKVGDKVTYVSGLYYYDSLGTAPAGSRGQGKKATITQIKSGAPYPIHLQSTDSAYGWVKKSQISGYDTGGYTGNWGSEGKLAMLHEKELILNKTDTENMLKIIEMVRSISTQLESKAYMSSLAQLEANRLREKVAMNSNNFEQSVIIHAEFPDAVYATEIENALSNLVNGAAQYANRLR